VANKNRGRKIKRAFQRGSKSRRDLTYWLQATGTRESAVDNSRPSSTGYREPPKSHVGDEGSVKKVVEKRENTSGTQLRATDNTLNSYSQKLLTPGAPSPRPSPLKTDSEESSHFSYGVQHGIPRRDAEVEGGSPRAMGVRESDREHPKFKGEIYRPSELDAPYVQSAEGYLLDVKYDGELGRAVALIYVPELDRIVKWVDRTGHKPYFLVSLSPEEAGSPDRGVTSHPDFERFDIVTKIDPIARRKVTMTKIVVSNPLAVRYLREKFREEGAWEADIRYHHNYVYDNSLIPGMPYRVSVNWEPLGWDPNNVDLKKLEAVLGHDVDPETLKYASIWVPIFEVKPPEPCIASLDIEVYTPSRGHVPDPNEAVYPVISIAIARSDGSFKVFLLGSTAQRFESLPSGEFELEIYDDERSLILEALLYASKCPVLTTFNGDSFDLPYLYNRLLMLGVQEDRIPLNVGGDHSSINWGVHVDLYKLFDIRALQAYAFGNAYREKTLDEIARALLNVGKIELPDTVSNIPLNLLAEYNARDAMLTLRLLTDKSRLVWNLIVLLMRISKLGIEDATRTQVSGWIKSLMYWEHRRRGYLIPRKADIEKIGSRRTTKAIIKDKKYQGALVLEPPVGVFFNIVVLDFASLYPSIIKNWNLSYETVDNPYCPGNALEDLPGVEHKVCKSIRGITSELVGLLRDFRVKIYKKKAKDPNLSPEEREWFNVVQASMKVIINASYGVFGNEQFNFFSLALAESVTGIGRTILMNSLKKAEELNLHILYGDTDSLFVWAPREDALESLIRYVNEKYGLDLEVDKVFTVAVFSGLKKNYIGITGNGEVIIKGMMGKKRNMPVFIRQAFSDAVKLLQKLSEPREVFIVINHIRDYIKNIYRSLKNWEYTLDDLAFQVALTKDLNEYKKNTPQHVKAALQLEKYGVRLGKGDIVAFVKVKGGLGVKPVQLASMREVDLSKYIEHLKTAFEQVLAAFGITWDDITGLKSLEALLGRR